MSDRFTAACVQTNSGTEVEPNLRAAGELVHRARDAGADLIALPETVTAIVFDAVCRETGTEIAQPLFWQNSTHGTFHTPAKVSATWKSCSLVAPSPM